MTDKNTETGRFGGPGSHQPTGKKGGGDRAGQAPAPGTPTNPSRSRNSGGGGERDAHHTHTEDRS